MTTGELIVEVADLLAQEQATAPDFFEQLRDALAKRGYNIEAHQGGINGTYLRIVPRPR